MTASVWWAGVLWLCSTVLADGETPARTTVTHRVVEVSALALLAAATWLLVLLLVELTEALLDLPTPVRRGSLRLGVAALVAASIGSPASADAPLPAPDRATSSPTETTRTTERPGLQVVVRPGDTLWHIAEGLLVGGHDASDVLEAATRLHRTNRDAIGPDPDLIHPGIRLRIPPPHREERP